MEFFKLKRNVAVASNANAFGARAGAVNMAASAGGAGADIAPAAPDYLAQAVSLRQQMHTFLDTQLREHKNTREPYAKYISTNPGKNALNAILNTPILKHKIAINEIHIPYEQKQLAKQYKNTITLAKSTRNRGRNRSQRKTRKL